MRCAPRLGPAPRRPSTAPDAPTRRPPPARSVHWRQKRGEVEFGFFPNAAPVTVAHILKLFRLRCYDTNHIFRVDKGFVAQIQSVSRASVTTPLSPECDAEAAKTVPGEFTPVPHTRGILSMGRMSDPNRSGLQLVSDGAAVYG